MLRLTTTESPSLISAKPKSVRSTRTGSNRVRIIGGEWRSRVIEFPDADGLRPTPDRVRETLFNWLGQTLYGKRCLDVFAGSGALGLEAASRGAAQVLMFDLNRAAIDALQTNAQKLAANNVVIRQGDGLAFLKQTTEKFDVMFIDPPFTSGLMESTLVALRPCLAADARVYAEWRSNVAALPEVLAHWQVLKQGKAGQVFFALLCSPISATLITQSEDA